MDRNAKDVKVLRCISWVAVSSSPQAEEESPKDQAEKNLVFIENLGSSYPGFRGVLVDELSVVASRSIVRFDDAALHITAYAQLESIIHNKGADLLVCRSTDRLGRRRSLASTVKALCEDAGIVVVARNSLPATLDLGVLKKDRGRNFVSAIESVMAEDEIVRLMERHEMGMAARVSRKKMFPNQVPFGYRYVHDQAGNRRIEVVEQERSTIRFLLIDLFVHEGLGRRGIATRLNDMGHLSPSGRKWTGSSVGAIFRRVERYAGFLELNKRTVADRPYLKVRGSYEQIITDEELKQIQAEFNQRSFTPRRRSGRPFSGIVICALCGRVMHANTHVQKHEGERRRYPNMRCVGHGHCLQIADHKVMIMVRQCVEYLAGLVDVRELLDESQSDLYDSLAREIDSLLSEREGLAERRARLINAHVTLGAISESEFAREMTAIEKRQSSLDAELSAKQDDLDATDTESKTDRLDGVRKAGLDMLEVADSDPAAFNSWLRQFLRLVIGPEQELVEVRWV